MQTLGILLLLLLVVFMILLIFRRGRENFKADFTKSAVGTEFFRYLDMNDHKTLARLQRGNSGKTVILLHNSPLNFAIWHPVYQTMQRRSLQGSKTPNLVTYDLRGHGTAWMAVDPKYNDSNVNNQAWNIEQFVSDLKKVYDGVVGGGKVVLCGYGFGGRIAQKYALTYPKQIEKLVILQTTITPGPGFKAEIDHLSGPNGWIAKHPNVTYLTMDQKHIQETLCNWFYLEKECSNSEAGKDNQNTAQYALSAKLWREASATTELQADKIASTLDLLKEWETATDVSFPIHLLAATEDPLAPPDLMTKTYTTMNNANRALLVALDIVVGRHGYSIMRPDYIVGIICEDCSKGTKTAGYLASNRF